MTRDSGQASVLVLGVVAITVASMFGLVRLAEVAVASARAQAVADAVALAVVRGDAERVVRANGVSARFGTRDDLGWAEVIVDGIAGSSRAAAPTP